VTALPTFVLSPEPVASSDVTGRFVHGKESDDMLDGAFTSPKIRRLGFVLTIPWPHALGLCGLLWRFAAKHAPTGEVGRHDDIDLATALEWGGDATALVDAFVDCRLLDRIDGPGRLVVHDWPDHAPRYVGATLRRRNLEWSPAYAEGPRTAFASTATATDADAASDAPPGSDADAVPGPGPDAGGGPPGASRGDPGPPGADPDPGTALGGRQTPVDPSYGPPAGRTGRTSSGPPNALGGIVGPSGGNPGSKGRRGGTSVPADRVRAIWAGWVPGRKTGKARAITCIVASARRLVADGEVASIDEALDRIEAATQRDRERYCRALAKGETELQFIPLGVTYFAQERWQDDDDEPTDQAKEATDAIRDEISRLRQPNVG
jgi:hypothetical protein